MAIALIWQGFDTTVHSTMPRPILLLGSIGIAAGHLSLLLFLVYSVAGMHDYLDWNRERWSAVRRFADELAIPTPRLMEDGNITTSSSPKRVITRTTKSAD
jgi:hypothetical protein